MSFWWPRLPKLGRQSDRGRGCYQSADRELLGRGFGDFESLGEGRADEELQQLLRPASAADGSRRPASPDRGPSPTPTRSRAFGCGSSAARWSSRMSAASSKFRRATLNVCSVWSSPMVAWRRSTRSAKRSGPVTTSRRSRVRLRNVLLRLRRVAGDILTFTFGSGLSRGRRELRPPGVRAPHGRRRDGVDQACRSPDLAGHLADQAVRLADGPVFGEFEYEEWAITSLGAQLEHRLIGLLDLLSVQAEDVRRSFRWRSRWRNVPCASTGTRIRATSGSLSC